MDETEFAKIKLILPNKSRHYKHLTRVLVNGQPLRVTNFILSAFDAVGRTELVLHIPPDSFEIEIEEAMAE